MFLEILQEIGKYDDGINRSRVIMKATSGEEDDAIKGKQQRTISRYQV